MSRLHDVARSIRENALQDQDRRTQAAAMRALFRNREDSRALFLETPASVRKGGRPRIERRNAYRLRFGLTAKQATMFLRENGMDQLDRCKDDEARRLLLGTSEVVSA